LAVKSALLGTRHPRKEKEAALQTVTGKPACLDGKIVMSTQSEREPSVKICKIEVRSSQPAGTPNHRASQGLLPGAPTKQGAAYLPYLKRPTKPTSKGGGGTYLHTETYIPRLVTTEKQAQSGSPKMRNPTVETPTNHGERVKRCPNEIRAYMYDPSVLPSFLHSFLASFSTFSTAPVGRTPTVRHLGDHLA